MIIEFLLLVAISWLALIWMLRLFEKEISWPAAGFSFLAIMLLLLVNRFYAPLGLVAWLIVMVVVLLKYYDFRSDSLLTVSALILVVFFALVLLVNIVVPVLVWVID